MKSVLIIGMGRFGRHVAIKLNELGHEVLAVDKAEQNIKAALPYVTGAQRSRKIPAEKRRRRGRLP